MTNLRSPSAGSCLLEIRPYRRRFIQPLLTSHGTWSVREGAIVRVSAQGCVGYGEIAPIPWFGSESLTEAIEFCTGVAGRLTVERLATVPDHLPATQFALESAWVNVMSALESAPPASEIPDASTANTQPACSPLPMCGLLPTGEAALQAWPILLDRGYTTLKWKIGVGDRHAELLWLQQLADALPPSVALRLDANGGLDETGAAEWLSWCDRCSIECLEQPLPPPEFDALLRLQGDFSTPIALDESVATLHDLQQCIARGWGGIVVIKPAICGFPSRVQQFCQTHQLDVIVSSALETSVGRQAALSSARAMGSHRALGFGVDHLLQPVPQDWPASLWQTSPLS